MAFDWTRWPYDPEDNPKHVIEDAVQALRDDARAGMAQVERAVGALDVALGMVASKVSDNHGDTLASLDRANRDIRQKLDNAMDDIYEAAKIADGV